MKTYLLVGVAVLGLTIASVRPQTPAPIILQAANAPGAQATPRSAVAATATSDPKAMFQLLQEMQATNEATLKKQEAALDQLGALQKAADELKIFSKRG